MKTCSAETSQNRRCGQPVAFQHPVARDVNGDAVLVCEAHKRIEQGNWLPDETDWVPIAEAKEVTV